MFSLYIISISTIISLIIVIILKPEIKLNRFKVETFWVVSILGAAFLIAFGHISINEITEVFLNKTSINPLKILTLFISMTILSIVLDELGFFQKLAYLSLKKAKNNQIKIFIYLYLIISILTIFSSNDIIILTFTPFICYFTKHAKINPIPYLISEFVAANTWSMMLVIGNPTNIFLASLYKISFFNYLKVMVIPTIISSLFAFGLLFIIFKKELSKNIEVTDSFNYQLKNKYLVIISLIHLGLCTILITIASYLNLEMWYICLNFAVSILLFIAVYDISKKRKPTLVINTLKRAPWSLVPFVLSMFIFVIALNKNGITDSISIYLNKFEPIISYGMSSFLSSNIINNIPMTVLFSYVINNNNYNLIFPTIIGSNIGAFLTPIGALAGIMWMRILKNHKVKFSFGEFMKYGFIISIPTIIIALLVLSLII